MLDLTVLEDWEVGALITALHEARFPEKENDPGVWLSPFVVDLHVAAVDEQRRRVVRRIDERASRGEPPAYDDDRRAEIDERWAAWRGRREDDVVRRRLDEDMDLRRWLVRDGVDGVRHALRPFVVDDESAGALIRHAVQGEGSPERAARLQRVVRHLIRRLPDVHADSGDRPLYEVATVPPGRDEMTDPELTDRPLALLVSRGEDEESARDALHRADEVWTGGTGAWRGPQGSELVGSPVPELVLPADFDDDSWLLESKGWWVGEVTLAGRGVEVIFYDPVRLSQDLAMELESDTAIVLERVVVVPRLTLEAMRGAVTQLPVTFFGPTSPGSAHEPPDPPER